MPSEHDQNARYRLQQSALGSFHAEIQGYKESKETK